MNLSSMQDKNIIDLVKIKIDRIHFEGFTLIFLSKNQVIDFFHEEKKMVLLTEP